MRLRNLRCHWKLQRHCSPPNALERETLYNVAVLATVQTHHGALVLGCCTVDQAYAFGVFVTFKKLRNRVPQSILALGDVKPANVDAEHDAWAEHFRLIGEGEGMVADRVWDNIPSYSPMDAVWGRAPAPNELHAALRQMSWERRLVRMRLPLNF